MFKSIRYVITENVTNIYRIYCIAKYELLGEIRDSKFGLFWNFASPAIQVVTFYLVFGLALSRGKQ
ncbi:MAG: ABC transporter permease, partial [Longicatena sp.]